MPVHDYLTHSSTEEKRLASPKRIILIDGILIFSDPELLKMMDIKIFVDTDDGVRLLRRLRRDIEGRGRDLAGVPNQYENIVRPVPVGGVEAAKRDADIIIPHGGENKVALNMIIAMIKEQLNG